MIFRWFLSREVRRTVNLCKHVRKLVNAQRDLLNQQAIDDIALVSAEVREAIRSNAKRKALRERTIRLEKVVAKWIRVYPFGSLRENVEVILVAVTVALGIRTFFVQPFKIPTGSMQPTLYGITAEDLREQPGVRIPTGLAKFFDFWINGNSYHQLVAQSDGMLEAYEPPKLVIPFIYKQRFRSGEMWYTVWSGWDKFLERGLVEPGHLYRKGDDILKVKMFAGDHLFVDRLTYNFRRPRRGEILVFKTEGIRDPAMPQDQFYIKRMVAMSEERVQVGDDRHLLINGERIDHIVPHFENVYSFDPNKPPKPSAYSGHVNSAVVKRFRLDKTRGEISPLFPDEHSVFAVRRHHYLVMGDNTLDSYDGRAWGDFSRTNVIGKSWFVYWPITGRFGWTAR